CPARAPVAADGLVECAAHCREVFSNTVLARSPGRDSNSRRMDTNWAVCVLRSILRAMLKLPPHPATVVKPRKHPPHAALQPALSSPATMGISRPQAATFAARSPCSPPPHLARLLPARALQTMEEGTSMEVDEVIKD